MVCDNKKIIIPNSSVMSGTITNITAHDTRRVDMSVGVSYSDDLDKVQAIVLEVLTADERVLSDPAPQVVVSDQKCTTGMSCLRMAFCVPCLAGCC